MKTKISTIVLVILGCVHLAIAQPPLKKALLVNNHGDTLQGWVIYKGWEKPPLSIDFSVDSSSSHTTAYTVVQVAYIEIEGKEVYERQTIGYPVPFASLNPLTDRLGDTLLHKKVWLRLLLKGQAFSLYRYADDKTSYFGREGRDEIDLLPERGFQNPLNMYAKHSGHEELMPEIMRAAYQESSLIPLFKKLNGDGKVQSYTVPVLRNPPQFFVGLGAGFSSMAVSGDVSYLGRLYFGSALGPHVRLGMDYVFASGLSPWAMRLELSYSNLHYKATGTAITTSLDVLTYELQQRNISPVFSVLYHVLNQRNARIYLGAGVAYNFSSFPANTLTHSFPETLELKDYVHFTGGWLSANAKLGVIIRKRWEAGTEYLFGNYSQEMRYSFNPHTFLAWLGYRLH